MNRGVDLLVSVEGTLRARATSDVFRGVVPEGLALVDGEEVKVEIEIPPTGRQLLAAAGSTVAVAKNIGASRQLVWRWLHSPLTPSQKYREKLAAVFGIPIDSWPQTRTSAKPKAVSGRGRGRPKSFEPASCVVCGVDISAAATRRAATTGKLPRCPTHAAELHKKPRPQCFQCGVELRRTKKALAGAQRCRACRDLANVLPDVCCADCGVDLKPKTLSRLPSRCRSCAARRNGLRGGDVTKERFAARTGV